MRRRAQYLLFYRIPFSEKEKRRPNCPSRPECKSDGHFLRGRELPTVVQSRPNSGKGLAAARANICGVRPSAGLTQLERAPKAESHKPIPVDSNMATSEHDCGAIYYCGRGCGGDPGHGAAIETKGRGRRGGRRQGRSSNGTAAGFKLQAANRLRSSGRESPARQPGGIQTMRAGPKARLDQTNQA
jgi:hypothetical protein